MKLGSFFGVKVVASYLFLALLGVFWAYGYLLQALILVGTLLTHELAHLLVARYYGLTIDQVELFPFGGVARIEAVVEDPQVETAVALAGPLHNFFLVSLAVVLERTPVWDPVAFRFFQEVNLLMAFFNLLPALPLDGGRVLRAWLAGRIGYRRATAFAARAGEVLSLLLLLGGAGGLALGRLYLSPLLLAPFLFQAARKEHYQASYVAWKETVRKKESLRQRGILAVHQLVVTEQTPVRDVLKQFVPRRYHLVTVMDRRLRPRGMLTETELVDALVEVGPLVSVGEVVGRKG